MHTLRNKLVDLALTWERTFGNAPHITAALSELDAALLDDRPAECLAGEIDTGGLLAHLNSRRDARQDSRLVDDGGARKGRLFRGSRGLCARGQGRIALCHP